MRAFDQAPFLVLWEVTRACELACVHCRASAVSRRHPLELSTEECLRLLDEIRRLGPPLLVFTGGDPLKRPDLFRLLQNSVEQGIRTTITPSATSLLTPEALDRFRSLGVARMALSLDGPDAVYHDGFRRTPGSFERTVKSLHFARRIGLSTQVNTSITRTNLERLEEIAAIVEAVEARLWSVFFLVPTGRAKAEDDLSAEEYEEVFSRLDRLSRRVSFDIKTTEAPHYRRYMAQNRHRNGKPRHHRRGDAAMRQSGINDGRGLLFISHTGEVYPSGFLPLSAGNIRSRSLQSIYRDAPLFRSLRDDSQLEGKCGICPYRKICGGSRARAYALTGNPLGEELRCVYQPEPDAANKTLPGEPLP